ncbi:MAG: phosphatidate cytidylyltransferase [Firmicutes bacterium]|nr:phosphatidate cytidylyltransferase [Bacillota bacterium]
MLKRILTVVIGLPIVVFLVSQGGLLLILLCMVMALIGLRELFAALSGKHEPIHFIGYIFTVGYYGAIYLFGTGYTQLVVLTIFIIVAQTCMVLFFKKLTLKECVSVIYGVLYIPFLLSFTFLVREQNLGQYYVWLIFASAFGSDTFAFLVGTTIGKRKLTGTPSPSKSLEGLIGGFVGAALVGGIYGFTVVQFSGQLDNRQFIIHAVIICAVTAVFCAIGDMAASAIKRYTGIKDFGNVFPGHGGVLDRIDSILIAAPVIYMAVNVMNWLVAR